MFAFAGIIPLFLQQRAPIISLPANQNLFPQKLQDEVTRMKSIQPRDSFNH